MEDITLNHLIILAVFVMGSAFLEIFLIKLEKIEEAKFLRIISCGFAAFSAIIVIGKVLMELKGLID